MGQEFSCFPSARRNTLCCVDVRDRNTVWGTHVRLDTPVRVTRKIHYVPRYQRPWHSPFKMEKLTPRPGDAEWKRRHTYKSPRH